MWTADCQNAFEELKKRVTQAPILTRFDPDKPTVLKTDASDFVVAGVLSQGELGDLRPVAFFSKSMAPAECNYDIHDKELLAIIRCLQEWRAELKSVKEPVKIFTDHKNLECFCITKKLINR